MSYSESSFEEQALCRRPGCNGMPGINGLCLDCFIEWKQYLVSTDKPDWIKNLGGVRRRQEKKEKPSRCIYNDCHAPLYTGMYCRQHQFECMEPGCKIRDIASNHRCKKHEKTLTRAQCKWPPCRNRSSRSSYCDDHQSVCAAKDCRTRELVNSFCAAHQEVCLWISCESHNLIGSYCIDHLLVCKQEGCDSREVIDEYCASHEKICLEEHCESRDLNGDYCNDHQVKCRVFTCVKSATTTLKLCENCDAILKRNPRAPNLARKCLISFCENRTKVHEHCNGHDHQIRRGVEITPIRPQYPDKCVYCGRPHYSSFLCSGHYQQMRRGQELRPLQKFVQRHCQLNDCEREYNCQDLCKTHYRTWQKIIRKLKEGKEPNWTTNQRAVYTFMYEEKGHREYGELVLIEGRYMLAKAA